MSRVWAAVALLALCYFSSAFAISTGDIKREESKTSLQDSKKEAQLLETLKKHVAKTAAALEDDVEDGSGFGPSLPIVVTAHVFSGLHKLAAEYQNKTYVEVDPQNRTIQIGDTTFTTGFADLLTGLTGGGGVGGLPNLGNLFNFPALGNINGLTGLLAVLFALPAILGAGLAALIAFVVPPLQIINQILAIIALAMLAAYLAEDKVLASYISDYTGYDAYDYGGGYGFSSSGSDTGYGDTSGYSSGGGSGSTYSGSSSSSHGDNTGLTSSYSDYRRSDLFAGGNSLDGGSGIEKARKSPEGASGFLGGSGRSSNVARPLLNTVSKMVHGAIKTYSKLYGE